jgi:hypothetical protein
MNRCERQASWVPVLFALLSGTLACSSDSISRATTGGPEETGNSGEEPVYVAFVAVPAVDGYTFYATTLRALDGSNLSLDTAIEIPGNRGNRMYVNGTSVFVGESESANIVRYDVLRTGELVPGQRMSLTQLGATPGNVNLFASDERAYLVDQWGPTGLQIIKWNPRTMETVGTLDISAVGSSDYIDFDVQSAVRWGNYFAIPYSLKNWDNYEIDPDSTVLLLDADTEETRVITAPGCAYTTSAVVSADGDLYLGSSSFAYLFKQFDPTLSINCVARVRADSLLIDETYKLDLTGATAGRDAGDLAYTAGRDGYTLSFYPEETEAFDPANPFAIFDANAWRPWAVDLSSGTGRELDFPLSSAAMGMITLDQKPYRLVGLADGSTEVYEVLDDGSPRLALAVPGSVYVLARIY